MPVYRERSLRRIDAAADFACICEAAFLFRPRGKIRRRAAPGWYRRPAGSGVPTVPPIGMIWRNACLIAGVLPRKPEPYERSGFRPA